MEKLSLIIIGNKIQIQRSDYIEDGWYILVNKDKIQLYEILFGGGEPIFIGEYKTLIEAITQGKNLI